VPLGVKGELYVGGAGVGRGYLNDAVQTAEAFVPDPFGTEAGARLYRTGDLARYRTDGAIEYLGRRDEQVKVRGFRIELTEIEATLNLHQQISESVVMAVSNGSADSHLVAYFVAPENLESGAPQEFLRERLPDYMIPAAFIRLPQMPLTPNGKIDRGALPAPAPELLERPTVFVAPETETEKAQAEVWAQLLKLDQVGIEDNFFELGGHSLGATQLVTRIAANFGVELTLAEFFAAPTIKAVSQKIETALLQQTSATELDEMLSALEEMGDVEVQNLMTLDDARKQSW
jgi:long-subunit acyl-CoA synthetase (AMP-forming)